MITIEIHDEETIAFLKKAMRRAKNPRAMMRAVAEDMLDAVEANFEQEGRPKWPALAPSTLANRKEKGYTGKMLQATGRLAGSITPSSGATFARVGTNVEYAAVHQFGGETGPFVIRPRNKKALFWPGAEHPVKSVTHPGFKIPARPFLQLTDEDLDRIKNTMLHFIID